MFFASTSNYPVGLDISDTVLRLVQLNKAGAKIKIQGLSFVKLEKGLIEKGEIMNEEAVLKKINELISRPFYGKISSDSIVACLPEPKTFIKLISVEKGPNKLSEIIESEIEKNIPYTIKEVYYDWQIINDRDSESMVLIGATPKGIVNQYTSLLDKAKLSIQALEIEPISICRCLIKEESPDYKGVSQNNYAILDIGANRTSMIFYSANTILYTISIPISGNKITENISKKLELDIDQAEKAKIICGFDKGKAEGVINKTLSENIGDLKNKINESLNFYQNYYNRGPINKIILCGGGANINGLDKVINEATSIEVVKGDLFTNAIEKNDEIVEILTKIYSIKKGNENKNEKNVLPAQKVFIQDSSLSFVTAFGLALRGIFINDL
jgi:type IV pilus assembly protein PilM